MRVADRGFDQPDIFSAYLHTLRWSCVTATDPRLLQAPYRAGIEVMAYQLEPLRKALLLPRVNLFIADDVGLGKTIEAGLILRELILRQKVRRVVVAAPPWVVIQWRDELEQRFGLTFVVFDRDYVVKRRRERGFGVNPFTTHSRLLNEKIVFIAFESDATFAVLQSNVHETWRRFLNSSLKDDMQYTPSACFATFPFPRAWETNAALESAGQTYYEYRAGLMVRNNQGLTTTYNRFHDPDERDPEILRLRELHAVMDRAVLDAYGWSDLQPTCEFLLDYDDEDDEDDESTRKRKKKKPWRYRWPDDVRDEVLARLLALNAERAAEEKRLGLEAALTPASREPDEDGSTAGAPPPKPKRKAPGRKTTKPSAGPDLFTQKRSK